jgi:predicted nucleotidyltransferase
VKPSSAFRLLGGDTESSDLDILVDPLPGATLFDLGGFQIALQELLGCLWTF